MSEHRLKDKGKRVFWEVVRVVIRETIRAARAVREIYTVKPENEEEKLHRERYQEEARRKFLDESRRRESRRRRKGDWVDWMNENVHPNTPPWMQVVNRAIYEWSLMMAVIFVVGSALMILFIVVVSMG